MAKLYPGTGSSYYFAEQSFLNHEKAWKYARLSKFIVGWGSHLYYWIYPGVMVGFMGVLCGYLAGTLWPGFMNASNPGPVFMMLVAVVFSFAIAWIAQRGVNGSTSVNIAINVIQITALLVFAVMAFSYRTNHPAGTPRLAFRFRLGRSLHLRIPDRQSDGERRHHRRRRARQRRRSASRSSTPPASRFRSPSAIPEKDEKGNFLSHPTAASVVGVHNFSWAFIQATVAILILVGFESVTAMGGEAKNAKRDVPIAVIASLLVQGCFCYLIEYFAAELLPEQRLHDAERLRFGGSHRRHDGHHRQRSSSARAADASSCWWKRSRSSWRSSAPRFPA